MQLDPIDRLTAAVERLEMATRAQSLPAEDRWIDAEGIAALVSLAPRTVAEKLVCRPDFPRPLRIGHPRWNYAEVVEYLRRTPHPARGRRLRGVWRESGGAA